jgi:hypothetical protein
MLLTAGGFTVELLLKYGANYWWCYCRVTIFILRTSTKTTIILAVDVPLLFILRKKIVIEEKTFPCLVCYIPTNISNKCKLHFCICCRPVKLFTINAIFPFYLLQVIVTVRVLRFCRPVCYIKTVIAYVTYTKFPCSKTY